MKLVYSATLILTLTAGNAWAAFEGNETTSFGVGAGSVAGDVVGSGSTFVGRNAGFSTTGISNTFVGYYSGLNNTTGFQNTFVGRGAGRDNTVGTYNTFIGQIAGNLNTTGNYNTFIGQGAGRDNTTGINNTYLGQVAGRFNTTGNSNTYIGKSAGDNNATGSANTFLGRDAGVNSTGSGNVFLGYAAGQNELGSNLLYIANSNTAAPLIFGDFATPQITINGNLEVRAPYFGIVEFTDVATDLTTKGARMLLRHYNNAQSSVYLFGAASTPGQNFVAFGGGNTIGNAATQLDFFTAANNTTLAGTSRMTILGNGNVGVGTQAPLFPLQMASGALVTAGGVWTNASSRDYKENIQSLSNQDAVLTLAKLNPVTYNYKLDKEQAHVGFIAEDVPELVATKDRKGLSPMDIVAVLTKVAQEQQRVIAELRTELKELKQEVRLNGARASLN